MSDIESYSSSEIEGESYSYLPVVPIRPYPIFIFQVRRSPKVVQALLQRGVDILDITLEVEEYQPPFHEEENLPEDFDFRRIRPYNSPYIQNGFNENGANLIPTSLSDFERLPGFERVFQRDYSPVPEENRTSESESFMLIDRHPDVRPSLEDRRTPIRDLFDEELLHLVGVERVDLASPPSYDDAVLGVNVVDNLRHVNVPDRWDNIIDRARAVGTSEFDFLMDEIAIPTNEVVENRIMQRAETFLRENREQRERNESFWSGMVIC